jgi:hypothetical protein
VSLSDHARANRVAWGVQAADYEASGRRNWATDEITWGICPGRLLDARGADNRLQLCAR